MLATIEAFFESQNYSPVLAAHAPTLPTHSPTGTHLLPLHTHQPQNHLPASSSPSSCLQPHPAEATLRRAVLVPKESRP